MFHVRLVAASGALAGSTVRPSGTGASGEMQNGQAGLFDELRLVSVVAAPATRPGARDVDP